MNRLLAPGVDVDIDEAVSANASDDGVAKVTREGAIADVIT